VKSYIRLLQNNPNFGKLWSAQVVSLLGDWFNTIVLSTRVVNYSDGSGLAISLFLMARFLPPLIVGPFAGVLVDRFDRKRILIYSNILRTGIVLLFLLTTTPNTLWLIYVLTIIQFTLSALFEPGQSAITPSLVSHNDLVLANTLASITWSVMLAVGAIIGGAVSAIFGESFALIFDALTFAVAAWIISRINVTTLEFQSDSSPQSNIQGGSFMDGLRFLNANRRIAAVLLVKGGGSLGNVDVLMTIYATQIFVLGKNGQLSLGIMYSAFGLGAILGPLILNRFHSGGTGQLRRLVIIGFIWAALGWLIIGLAGTLAIASLALLIRGMGGSANWTYSSVIIQKSVPDRFLGRVFSLDLAVFQLATVLSIFVHGTLIDFLTSRIEKAQLLNLHHIALGHELDMLLGFYITDKIALIAFGTAFVSLIPLVLWTFAVPRMERRELALAIGLSD
jgi:MFS family permease